MRLIKIMERGGDEYRDYKKALHMAKKGVEMLYELTEEMESEYGDYGDYSARDHDDYEDRRGIEHRRRVR